MNRAKAALIADAFDSEDEQLFRVLGDWMEDAGEDGKEIERFRLGNWNDEDYSAAMRCLFARQIESYAACTSYKMFVKWFNANMRHEKFMKWFANHMQPEQKELYDILISDKVFQEKYGKVARDKYIRWYRVFMTEENWHKLTMGAHKVCCDLKKRADAAAWKEMWRDRRWYIRDQYDWEKPWKSPVSWQ